MCVHVCMCVQGQVYVYIYMYICVSHRPVTQPQLSSDQAQVSFCSQAVSDKISSALLKSSHWPGSGLDLLPVVS